MSKNFKFNFKKTFQSNFSNILKSTKNLALNSPNSLENSKIFFNITQTTLSFKNHLEQYPIIKNKDSIPLNCRIFSLSSERLRNLKRKILEENKTLLLSDSKNNKTTHRRINTFSNNFFFKTQDERDEIFILRNNIFYDESYSNLKYDESEIFNKEVYYNKFIKSYIEKIKIKKTENFTSCVQRNFYKENIFDSKDNTQTKITSSIEFKSMIIKFINQNNPKKIFSFEIPFSYLPIFYFNNMENLKFIILSIFKFSDDFENVYFDEDELYNLIQKSEKFKFTRKKNEKKETLNDKENINRVMFKLETNIFNENHTKKIIRNPYLFKTEGHYTKYNFIWFTPKNSFKIIINNPMINVRIKRFYINKNIDKELFLFLLKRDFLNWDFFIVHYLFSFKSFRWVIRAYLSKDNKKTILSKYNPEKNGYIRFEQFGSKLNIFLNKERILSSNLNNNYMIVFYTNEQQKNYLKIFNSYSVIINNETINNKKDFFFSFSFNQMIILNKISKLQKLKYFLYKLLYTNNSNIYLNFDFFEHYNDNFYMEKSPLIDNNNQTINTFWDRKSLSVISKHSLSPEPNLNNINQFIIKITNPYIETIEYFNQKSVEGNCIISNLTEDNKNEINKNNLDEICNSDIINWPKYIIQFSKNDKSYFEKEQVTKAKIGKHITVKNLNHRKFLRVPTINNKFFNLKNKKP